MQPAGERRQVASPQFAQVDSHKKCPTDAIVTSTDIEVPADITTTDNAFSPKLTYKPYISICIQTHTLTPTKFPLDTGAGLNLTNANFIYKRWAGRTKHANLLRLRTKTKKPTKLYETILLHL